VSGGRVGGLTCGLEGFFRPVVLVPLSCGDAPVFARDRKTSDGAKSHFKASPPE
jgi:hypothetical protein